MASIQDIIKVLKSKTALYSMGNGNASAIPESDFMEVALEINKLFYKQQADLIIPLVRADCQRETRKLIKAYDAYVKALEEENGSLVGFASTHGWSSSRVEFGKNCRKKIKELQANTNKPNDKRGNR